MRRASLTLIFIISGFYLLAQPAFLPETKLHDIDTSVFPIYSIDSIENILNISKAYGYNPNLRIQQSLDDMPSIVSYTKYLYITTTDSIPDERGEAAFNENGKIIYSSRYFWDQDDKEWYLWEKMEIHYDHLGRDTSSLIYQQHLQENKMVLVYKWSADYNETGDIILNKHYSYYMHTDSWVETTWEYKYNDMGSLLTANHYFMDGDMIERLNISKLEQKYDVENNRVSREMYSHDKDMSWIGQEKMQWNYDPANRKRAEIAYVWDDPGSQWLLSRKSEYSGDSSNNINTETIYIHDNVSKSWRLDRKIDFTYDLPGNIISKVCFEYDSFLGKWIETYMFSFSYDSNGREIESTQYDWDSDQGVWNPLWKKQVNYGSTVFLASYSWNNDLSDWIGDWKRETLYNAYGDCYLDAYYEWDSIFYEWLVKSGIRWDRNYDINGCEIEALGYNWNQEELAWEQGGKFEWFYDMDGDLTLYMDYAWAQNKEDWILFSKTFYNYRKGFVTGTAENYPDKITIYPNPTGSLLRIDGIENLLKVDIYSTSGNIMFFERVSQTLFDISLLPNGIYIIVLHRAGKAPLTKKIIKQ